MSVKRRVVVEDDEEGVEEVGENQEESDLNEEEGFSEENEAEEVDSGNEANSDESENDEVADTAQGNAGWADSIAKILKTNKPKGKKTLVLSRAKKLTDVRKDKSKYVGFEIAAESGEIKKEEIVEEREPEKVKEPVRKKKRELPNLRVKPNILHKDRERTLAKIATKGVVQLFNAVRMQQKEISTKLKEAGPLELKKDKVLKSIDKRAFLDVLMGEKSQSVDDPVVNRNKRDVATKKEKETSMWNVLRDDFMMSAKMKDWDKELENEIETEDVEME